MKYTGLAVDLGAGSGRVVRGTLDDDILRLEETARFPNEMITERGHLRWNTHKLFLDLTDALAGAARAPDKPLSIGIDTWGVDFALLDADDNLCGLPVAYRDKRTQGMMEKFLERVPRRTVYEKTGIQFLPINSLYQLFSMSENKSPELAAARSLLFIPDFFHFLLTGKKCTEFTNATTSQIFNIRERAWDADLLAAAGVDAALMRPVSPPGTILGGLKKNLQSDIGLDDVLVVAPVTHDTGSAVAAVPAEGGDWAFLSSGTWSPMGAEILAPVTTPEALEANFTNEGGVDGTVRFLKNIMGMWLLERCRADFTEKYDYDTLMRLTGDAPAFASLVRADDDRFLIPPRMTDAFADFCGLTGQTVPQSPGAFVRCALESLALHYRVVVGQLGEVLGKPMTRIHVVGGGSRNALLNQMTADATGLPVIAGPVEAAAAGNILMQARALGHIASLDHAREVVRRSFSPITYEPRHTDAWAEVAAKYATLEKINEPHRKY